MKKILLAVAAVSLSGCALVEPTPGFRFDTSAHQRAIVVPNVEFAPPPSTFYVPGPAPAYVPSGTSYMPSGSSGGYYSIY